jgi:hypothetical protein
MRSFCFIAFGARSKKTKQFVACFAARQAFLLRCCAALAALAKLGRQLHAKQAKKAIKSRRLALFFASQAMRSKANLGVG